jgi:hypothetical protein
MRFFSFFAICAFSFLISSGPSRAEDSPLSTDTAACTPAARLFGEIICEESLLPDGFTGDMLGRIPAGAEGDPIRNSLNAQKIEKLKDAIWKAGLVHKFGAQAVEPSAGDIGTFRDSYNASMDESYEMDKMTAVYTRELLEKNKYKPAAEAKIQGLLDAADASIKLYEQRKNHLEGMPDEYKFVSDQANQQVATMILSDWKADKVLYEAYGGQVYYTSAGGILPLGARARQLDYIRKEGKLKILNPAFSDVLKPMDDVIASPDNRAMFPDEAKKWAEKYLDTPALHSPMPGSQQRFQKLKEDLDSIPAVGPK